MQTLLKMKGFAKNTTKIAKYTTKFLKDEKIEYTTIANTRRVLLNHL